MGDLMNAIGSMLHSQPQSVHSLRALTLETDLIDDDPFYMEKRVAKLARNRNKHHGLEPPERGKPSKDLDIRRITNRVLTMGLPTTEPSNKQQHQININAASQFLNARYSSNYMVINLACNSYLNLADSIQGEYDDKIFGNRVINFPVSKAYKSNLKSLIDISKAITGYLTLDIRNVVVVHCFNGLAKTSTAVCSYLIFANIVENASDALDYFNLRRGLAPGTCASLGQRRYLEYFDALYSFNGKLNNPYAIYLSEICLNNVNGLIGDTGGKSVIGIEIYESSRLVLSTIPKRTTALESVPVRITSDSNSLTFKPINPLRVKRDIQIRFFRHIKSEKINQIITIASFTFHSGFIPTGLIRVSQSDLEISKKGGVSERSDFTIDIQIDPPPILNNEQSRIISYTAALDPSLSKCLKTLSTYHCVKPSDAVFLKLIQKQYDKSLGIIFFNLVFLSLSMTDNDLNAAKRYLEKLLNDFPILKLDTYDSDKPLKRDTIVENEPRNGNGRVESYYIQELGDPYKDDVVSKIQGDSRRMRDVLDRTSRNNNGPSALDRLQGRNGGDRPHNNGDSRARKDQQSFNDEDRQLDHMINDLDIRRSRRPEEYSRQNREHRRSRSSEKIREENNLKSNRAGPPMAGPPPPMAGPPPPPFNPMIAAPMPPAGGGPPPPPFNPMGGGPPPPPNPMGGGPPPPPPGPGGMAGFGAPEPFDPNKLSAKNKFHWKEIKNVQGSVWKDLQISAVNQPIVRLDIKKFEDLFCVVPGQKAIKKPVEKPKFTTFVEDRRSNNICIGLARFQRAGYSNADLFKAIEDMDPKLTVDDLLALTSIQPNNEELALAIKYEDSSKLLSPLGPAEVFIMDVLMQKQFRNQVLALLFLMQFPIDLASAIGKLDVLITITNRLKSSEDLKILLKTILDLGNLTNYEYSSGAGANKPYMQKQTKAAGFKIDGLARLADVKSADGKWNLMQFLVENIEKQHFTSHLLDINDEFGDLETVCTYDIKDISETVASVQKTLKQIQNLNFKKEFRTKLDDRLLAAKTMVDQSLGLFSEFVKSWKEAIIYFGEDEMEYMVPTLGVIAGGKITPDSLYVSLFQFFEAYRKSVLNLRKMKKDKSDKYLRMKKDIKITEPPKNAELVVSFDEMKAIAKKVQDEEYKEAANLFKRASMLPPLDRRVPKSIEKESDDDDYK